MNEYVDSFSVQNMTTESRKFKCCPGVFKVIKERYMQIPEETNTLPINLFSELNTTIAPRV